MKFLFLSNSKTIFRRQEYIYKGLSKHLDIDILFTEDILTTKYKEESNKRLLIDSLCFYTTLFEIVLLKKIDINKYHGLIITHELSPIIKSILKIFKKHNIPSFSVLHEGMYFDIKKWYKLQQTIFNSILIGKYVNVCIADHTFVWGERHKNEFLKRGYKGTVHIGGTDKFSIYENLKLDKSTLLHKIGIKKYNGEKILLFITQLFDFQINTADGLETQRRAISDLIEYSKKNNSYLIIRSILGYKLDLDICENHNHVILDGINEYKLKPEESIYLSDGVFGFNSTMLIEGTFLKKPVFSFKYIEYTSDITNSNTVYEIKNKEELFNIEFTYKEVNQKILHKIIGSHISGNLKKTSDFIKKNGRGVVKLNEQRQIMCCTSTYIIRYLNPIYISVIAYNKLSGIIKYLK